MKEGIRIVTIQVGWLDEGKTAVLWRFVSSWCVEDYHEAVRETYKLTRNVARYHVIVDFTEAQTAPPTIISAMRNQHARMSPRYKGTIVCGANAAIMALLNVVSNLNVTRGHYTFVDTREEAWALHVERFNLTAHSGS